jgi:signal transduction histidine kinase
MTLYLCWFNLLARGRGAKGARIRVRESEDMLAFEVVGIASSDAELNYLRDRVEALGGRLAVTSGSGDSTRVSGSLPLSR